MAFRSDKLQKWFNRVNAMNLHVPAGRGALWTGIGPDNAFRLGLARERFTLEMTNEGQSLNKGALKRELDRDFGPQWSEQKRQIWMYASQKFVSRMDGPVDVFIKQHSLALRDGMPLAELKTIESKIVFDELMEMEIAGQVVGNGKIEKVTITEFNEKLEPTNVIPVPISREWN